jgi:hypothetical protein
MPSQDDTYPITCTYCDQPISQASDGAWEDESGACGCGDGEHSPAPVATCLNCGEPITGDVAEFEGLPGRCFCMPCIDELGQVVAYSLAKTAPDSAWMTDPARGTFITGQLPDNGEDR